MRLSFESITDLIRSKLRKGIVNSDSWPWIRDVYPDAFVYQLDGAYYERTYTLGDDGAVTFGDATPVIISREYVPVTGFSVTANADGTVDLYGRVFRMGTFPDKNFSLTDPAEADAMISRFNARGGCKNGLEHKVKTVLGHELGTLNKLERIGTEFWGTMRLPAWLSKLGDKELGPDSVQTSLEFAVGLSGTGQRDIVGNALTFDPRIEDATLVAFAKAPVPERTKSADMDEKGFFSKLAALFGAAASDGTPVPQPVPPAPTPSPIFSADPTTDELRKRVALQDKALIQARARAFAAEQLAAKKVLPAELSNVESMFAAALESDSAGAVKFTASGEIEEGPMCKAIRENFSLRAEHKLTTEAIPAGQSQTEEQTLFAKAEPNQDLPISVDLKQFKGGFR